MAEKQTYQFKTEIEQLLDLLANALYTNKEIFLRELISNAADALNKIRFLSLTDSKILGDDAEFKIRIRFHEKEKTLEIEDNGVLSEKELQENIGTIAKSGTLQFLKNIKKDQKGAKLEYFLIIFSKRKAFANSSSSFFKVKVIFVPRVFFSICSMV